MPILFLSGMDVTEIWSLIPPLLWIRYHVEYPDFATRLSLFGFLLDKNWAKKIFESPVQQQSSTSSNAGAVGGMSWINDFLPTGTSTGSTSSSSLLQIVMPKSISHTLIHSGTSHLLGNIVAYATTMVNFHRIMHETSHMLPAGPRLHNGFAIVPLPVREAVLATSIFFLGAIFGGVPATAINRGAEKKRWVAKYNYGMEHGSLWENALKKLADSPLSGAVSDIFLCGASGGIYSLSGFCCVTTDSHMDRLSTLITIVPELCLMLQGLSEGGGARSHDGGSNSSSSTNTPHVVGHAAHIGGFVVGCLLGLGYRAFLSSRRRLGRFRNRGGSRGVGGNTRLDHPQQVQRTLTVAEPDGTQRLVTVTRSLNTVTGQYYDFTEEAVDVQARDEDAP